MKLPRIAISIVLILTLVVRMGMNHLFFDTYKVQENSITSIPAEYFESLQTFEKACIVTEPRSQIFAGQQIKQLEANSPTTISESSVTHHITDWVYAKVLRYSVPDVITLGHNFRI